MIGGSSGINISADDEFDRTFACPRDVGGASVRGKRSAIVGGAPEVDAARRKGRTRAARVTRCEVRAAILSGWRDRGSPRVVSTQKQHEAQYFAPVLAL